MRSWYLRFATVAACVMPILAAAQTVFPESEALSINWGKIIAISRSTPTLQLGAFPVLRRGSPIHDSSFAALKQLGADYVRYVPWLPYPRLAVAELEPPTSNTPPGTSRLSTP